MYVFSGSTRFGSIPLSSGAGESVASLRNSRIALRGETDVAGMKLEGYIETDFLNRPPRQPYRFRQYFGQITAGDWQISAGQEWSLLRPNRKGINTEGEPHEYPGGRCRLSRRSAGLPRSPGSICSPHGRLARCGRVRERPRRAAEDCSRWSAAALGSCGGGGKRGHRGASAAAVVHATHRVDIVTQQFWGRADTRDVLGAIPTGVRSFATLEGAEANLAHRCQVFGYAGQVQGARSTGNHRVAEFTAGFAKTIGQDSLGQTVVSAQLSRVDRELWQAGATGGMNFVMLSVRHYFGAAK